MASLRPVVDDILRAEDASPSLLCQATLESWHRRLFEGRVSFDEYVGGVRQHDPHRPCLAQNVAAAGGPGMHFERVPAALNVLCTQTTHHLERAAQWALPPEKRVRALSNLLARAGATFLKIHPFFDGNSRLVRLWLHVLTQRLRVEPLLDVLPPAGPVFSELKRAAMTGDMSPWLTFFGEGLAAQLTPSP